METARQIADSFKIRASQGNSIMGRTELTERQMATYEGYKERINGSGKPLTAIQLEEFKRFDHIYNNPELSTGAKTYCEKWLKERLYGRREEIKSKYIEKGNETEEDGFTLMTLVLGLGMVKKNTEYFENDYCCGTPDLVLDNDSVYDNKSSWSLATFPMFESECKNEDYKMQLNCYGELTKKNNLHLCYTLNDAAEDMIWRELRWIEDVNERYRAVERMVFTHEYFDMLMEKYFPIATINTFKEIPEGRRVKEYKFAFDPGKQTKLQRQVELCRAYIFKLLN